MILSRISKQVLHSIPVLSIFVLLGIMGYTIISPNNLVNMLSLGLGESDGEVYAESANSNTSLIIDNGELKDDNTTTGGGTVYSSHTVQVKADNITGYTLSITGPTNLTGSTTISGADGKQGSSLVDNTWGYGWNTTSTEDANITYNSFTGSAQNLETNTTTALTNNAIDITRKLVFAAKFGDSAANGHYKANVKLNLTVMPKTVTTYNYSVTYNGNNNTGGTAPAIQTALSADNPFVFYAAANLGNLVRTGYEFLGWSENSNATSVMYKAGSAISLSLSAPAKTLYAVWKELPFKGITRMQEMTPAICMEATIGDNTALFDSRDGETYTIQKLTDGNCWMTQNMKLDLSSVSLSVDDSDVTVTYVKGTATKVATASNWSTTNNVIAQWTPRVTIASSYLGDGIGYQTEYGYYYSWCAATANTSGDNGTCKDYAKSSTDALNSICPKGWHLPKGGNKVSNTPNRNVVDITTMVSNDFAYLRNLETGATDLGGSFWANDKLFAGPPAYFTLGGTDWYRAGFVGPSGLSYPGKMVGYLSRTYESRLYFDGSILSPSTSGGSNSTGYSVRCIAYSS